MIQLLMLKENYVITLSLLTFRIATTKTHI